MIIQLLLLALAFIEPATKCRVTGDFYARGGEVDFQRIDHCVGIEIETKNGVMLMHSTKWWVAIPTPATGGHQQFSYLWGSTVATFGGDTQDVAWGRTIKG